MIVVDTSAVWAVIIGEPESEHLLEFILERRDLAMSAATLVELQTLCLRRLSEHEQLLATRLLQTLDITIVPFDEDQAQRAQEGMRTFGRGSGSRARLNLGDAFAYGLATQTNSPLLCIGNDFPHTDVQLAWPATDPDTP
ncbi:type II toxin-antitoxin system VapC family toxin [uncultured Tessaracoccus sp.]|uniref:type II toxin-antitoxin system VapC family toxin n=1 Tax=uncultured Tessaracoccus sp. TaxID=905023 RepID=UPI0025E0F895|nr:type II toxin-antitoxin system VapC family toxin [uncultured Tessaracoccus sp.]